MKIKGLLHVSMIAIALILCGATGAIAEETTYEDCEWVGESAWSDGDLYVKKGNWATYTEFEAHKEVDLYAGRALKAGQVFFEEVDDHMKITIALADGWFFEEGEENVKIQDYATAPEEKPSPGRFVHKFEAKESPFSIDVPKNSFYGVHVNVEEMRCQDPEDPVDPEDPDTPF